MHRPGPRPQAIQARMRFRSLRRSPLVVIACCRRFYAPPPGTERTRDRSRHGIEKPLAIHYDRTDLTLGVIQNSWIEPCTMQGAEGRARVPRRLGHPLLSRQSAGVENISRKMDRSYPRRLPKISAGREGKGRPARPGLSAAGGRVGLVPCLRQQAGSVVGRTEGVRTGSQGRLPSRQTASYHPTHL